MSIILPQNLTEYIPTEEDELFYEEEEDDDDYDDEDYESDEECFDVECDCRECLYRALYGDDDRDYIGHGVSTDRVREKLRLKLELSRRKKVKEKRAASSGKVVKGTHKEDTRGLDELLSFINGKSEKKNENPALTSSKSSEKRARKKAKAIQQQKGAQTKGEDSDELPDLINSDEEPAAAPKQPAGSNGHAKQNAEDDFSDIPDLIPEDDSDDIPDLEPDPSDDEAGEAKQDSSAKKKNKKKKKKAKGKEKEKEKGSSSDEDPEAMQKAVYADPEAVKRELERAESQDRELEALRQERQRLIEEKQRLQQEKQKLEQEKERGKLKQEKLEKERLEKEKKEAEKKERLEKEQQEKERAEREKEEKRRKLLKEKLEQERAIKEKRDQERLEKERLEKERQQKQKEAEREKKEAAEKEKERQREAEREKKEAAEREKERQREVERERQQREAEREKERQREAERERQQREAEKEEKEKEKKRLEKEQQEKEREEERLAALAREAEEEGPGSDEEEQVKGESSSKAKRKKKRAAAQAESLAAAEERRRKKLQVASHVKTTLDENEECLICLHTLQGEADGSQKDKPAIVKLSCGCVYKFHRVCVEAWFSKKDQEVCPMCNNEVVEYIGVQLIPPEKSPPRPTKEASAVIAPVHHHPSHSFSSPSSSPPPVATQPSPQVLEAGYKPPQLQGWIVAQKDRVQNTINFQGLLDQLCDIPPPDFSRVKAFKPAVQTPYDPFKQFSQFQPGLLTFGPLVGQVFSSGNLGTATDPLGSFPALQFAFSPTPFAADPGQVIQPTATGSLPPSAHVEADLQADTLQKMIAQNQLLAQQLVEGTSDRPTTTDGTSDAPKNFSWNPLSSEFVPPASKKSAVPVATTLLNVSAPVFSPGSKLASTSRLPAAPNAAPTPPTPNINGKGDGGLESERPAFDDFAFGNGVNSEEAHLVVLAKSGNTNAFTQLFTLHQDALRASVKGLLQEERKEMNRVLEETKVRAKKSLGSYKFNQGGIFPWFYKIAADIVAEIIQEKVVSSKKK